MSKSYVSKTLRLKISEQARYRCGYCLTTQDNIGMPMNIEHIVPEALGGVTEEANLWLACPYCNSYKADGQSALDPLTQNIVVLFNPRLQVWQEHFKWSENFTVIIGLTPTGRATVAALKLNREVLIAARKRWVKGGLHRPED